MNSLQSSTSLGALVLALAATPVLAATTVSTATTTPLVTSSAGDVTVASGGTITVASGNAVTADSTNTVDVEGALAVGGADNATGVAVNAGTNATVTVGSTGTIAVTENFVPSDEDANGVADGIADGPIASASNRYGIHVLSGGATSGSISNAGTITVEGLNSGGIVVDSAYTGNIVNSGTIKVTGDNSVGVSTQAVNGNVTVDGTVSVVGAGAQGLVVKGDVSGTVTVQGTVSQATSFTDDNSATLALSRTALQTGKAAVEIDGNVAGGIYIAAPPVDEDSSNPDEDGDGVADASEGTGVITSYGTSPALQVGGATDITVGGVSSNSGTYSLAIDGSATGNSYYSKMNAYGVVIGGQGGNVNLTNGIGVTGTVNATTYDTAAYGLTINAGSTAASLYNSGTISAVITSPGAGTAVALQDLSGTLTTINNTGFIKATGSSTDTLTAIDLSANTTGVTINQYMNSDDIKASATYLSTNKVTTDPTVYTSIQGNILFGSGNDTLSASAGTITGATQFGAGDDTLALSGTSVYTGNVYFGTGLGTASLADSATFTGTMDFAGESGALTLSGSSVYTGSFTNAGNLGVTVNSGATLTAKKAETINFGSLTVNSGGVLGVYIDTAAGKSSLFNVANATLADGAKITATVTALGEAEGTYTVLTAGNLNVQGTLDSTETNLPFIYNGAVSNDANNIYLTIARKTTDELGLTRSQASAWDAIYATAQNDTQLTESLLQVGDSATLKSQVSALLPDHAGGVFDAVTSADRLVTQHLSDESSMFTISDVGGWFEPVYWRTSKDAGSTAGYKTSGWGLSAGFEKHTDLGYFGVSYAWLQGTVKDNGGTGDLSTGQHDLGAFWRTAKGPIMAWARIGGSRISVDSKRTFTGTVDDVDFTDTANGKWNGWLISGIAGASYKYQASTRFSLKPKIELEQYWLKENGYSETSTSEAMALTVDSRTSKETTVTPTVTAAYSLGKISPDWRPLTFQLEAGRREVISGQLGSTTAYFNGGDTYDAGSSFTITPESLKGAWIGEVSMLAGGYDFTWKISARAEQTTWSTDLSARASLSVAF
ncbi:autotransporter-like protein [Novosphingobium sp. PhB165]|uniref:autotransporter domain-containing protein n=1 Tax=Novosphingobium sp. PhB165 TaxID=2485105 RepID=UPI00104FE572|nr:autotransporter outer membrane beta-barrel domain-containing protein [Novosphingobium sp. PhB165]TCM17825.1 autotransporter-like protein [Novosphingobium sp. PhB165]